MAVTAMGEAEDVLYCNDPKAFFLNVREDLSYFPFQLLYFLLCSSSFLDQLWKLV